MGGLMRPVRMEPTLLKEDGAAPGSILVRDRLGRAPDIGGVCRGGLIDAGRAALPIPGFSRYRSSCGRLNTARTRDSTVPWRPSSSECSSPRGGAGGTRLS